MLILWSLTCCVGFEPVSIFIRIEYTRSHVFSSWTKVVCDGAQPERP